MSKNLSKQQICLRLQGVSRSQKAYIYQQLVDFEPFLTPYTSLLIEHHHIKMKKGKNEKSHFVRIILMEGEVQLEAEAKGFHVFDAIQVAKKHLMLHLQKIQENVISSRERNSQIHHILFNTGTLH